MMRTTILTILAAGAAGTLMAQGAASSRGDVGERLLAAAALPAAARDVRAAGVPVLEVGSVLEELRRRSVRADEAREVLQGTSSAAATHGPVANFGSFVQAALDRGLRGRELAAAIREEHVARGRGVRRAGSPGEAAQRPGKQADGKPGRATGKADRQEKADEHADHGAGADTVKRGGRAGGEKQRTP